MRSFLVLFLVPLAAAVALSRRSNTADNPDSLLPREESANPPSAITAQPIFTFNQLWNLQKKFSDSFIYPANVDVAKSINSTLLAEDVQGRVDITRTFNGRELNTEYLFGLFANLAELGDKGATTLLGIPKGYEIVKFAANQNVVSVVTRFQFSFPLLSLTLPIEIEAWNTFNSIGQISQYDATFRYWQWTVDYLLQAAGKKFGTNSTAATVATLQNLLAESICETEEESCKGGNRQYESREECLAFLRGRVRFGEAYELGRNTLLCRMVHQNMVPLRPDIHCPHLGKTGGGYCGDEKGYVETVENVDPSGARYFTNAPFIPWGFQGSGGDLGGGTSGVDNSTVGVVNGTVTA
ncbi:MAG: hypothetical protein Q9174_004912 [Haloplaca sp. 1 TL-2023]